MYEEIRGTFVRPKHDTTWFYRRQTNFSFGVSLFETNNIVRLEIMLLLKKTSIPG